MATESGRLVALVTHARHVPFVERERFGVGAREWAVHHAGFVLETCHRVEAYAVIRHDGEAAAVRQIPEGGRLHVDEAVVRHAIAVAVGRDSVVVGEDQVLHQLREAVAAARGNGTLDPILERLFTFALRAGRRARSWRQGPAPSLADLAIAAIERRAGSLRGRGLLVVGSGKMGALATRAGVAAGATVSIASRTSTRAEALAVRLGGRAVPFDPGEALAEVAGVVVALRGRWSMSAESDEALLASKAVVVDLSVPPAVAEGLTVSLGQRLVSADAIALGDHAGQNPLGDGPMGRLETLIDSTAVEFLAWLAAHDRRATAQALAEHAESDRQAELAELWRRLPQLDSEARDVIEGMSRHLAARLLRAPLERLGHDPDGRAERAVRELFGL